jgi:DNA-binding FadR family transcriptional regulator
MSHQKLVQLIRRIAREEAYEVIDEHLDEYEHKEKPVEDFEVEGEKTDGEQSLHKMR